jgi:hypothetical protein
LDFGISSFVIPSPARMTRLLVKRIGQVVEESPSMKLFLIILGSFSASWRIRMTE